jgi:glycosyltransferase involved in cell wall biosynthesis
VVGHAASFTEQKAQDVLIRAIARANRVGDVPIELVIAGDGSLRGYLEEMVHQEGVADRVHFLGFIDRPRVYKMMSEIDIYAMPSRWEGFCMAVLQAMAAEKPCVLTDIPAFEAFKNAASFVSVDDAEALSEAFLDLSDNEEKRKRLSRSGHRLVREEYSMEKTVQEYAEIYNRIV